MNTFIVAIGLATVFLVTVVVILWASGVLDIHISFGRED